MCEKEKQNTKFESMVVSCNCQKTTMKNSSSRRRVSVMSEVIKRGSISIVPCLGKSKSLVVVGGVKCMSFCQYANFFGQNKTLTVQNQGSSMTPPPPYTPTIFHFSISILSTPIFFLDFQYRHPLSINIYYINVLKFFNIF